MEIIMDIANKSAAYLAVKSRKIWPAGVFSFKSVANKKTQPRTSNTSSPSSDSLASFVASRILRTTARALGLLTNTFNSSRNTVTGFPFSAYIKIRLNRENSKILGNV